MAVAVSTAEGVVIAPQYVDCAQGETVWQVLSRMEGHTFTQGADGFVTSIDGVVANYSRFDSSGGYDLESPAAEAGAFVFTDTEIKDMAGYCDMVCAMADYNGADAPVRRYAEAEYAAAESGLSSGTADYAALAQTLREKMDAYEKEVIGADKVTAALEVTDLDGGTLTGYTVTVENAYGTESVFQAGEPVQLAAGEYTFRVEAGHSGARGTMTLETDGTVRIAGKAVTALAVPAGKEWLKAPILHRTTGKLEGDAYTSEGGGGHAAVYYVPDAVSGSYLYCVPGSDLAESGTYSTAAVRPVGYYTDIHGAERVKTGMPWQSMAASLAELLTASNAGNTVRVEAQYTGGGYTAYQWFDMTVVRTPTLAALEVKVQGVAQSIGFAPERETYELSVTADELVITPTAFASGYTVTVNGQETQSGTAVTLPVNAEGAEIVVTVSGGGRSRTYTLTVQRVAAVDVTVRHDSDVTVHVFNSAHAEIGAAEQGSGFDRFALVPAHRHLHRHRTSALQGQSGGRPGRERTHLEAGRLRLRGHMAEPPGHYRRHHDAGRVPRHPCTGRRPALYLRLRLGLGDLVPDRLHAGIPAGQQIQREGAEHHQQGVRRCHHLLRRQAAVELRKDDGLALSTSQITPFLLQWSGKGVIFYAAELQTDHRLRRHPLFRLGAPAGEGHHSGEAGGGAGRITGRAGERHRRRPHGCRGTRPRHDRQCGAGHGADAGGDPGLHEPLPA